MANMAVSCSPPPPPPPPRIFPSKPKLLGLTLGGKRNPPPHCEIYPQNLSTQYLVVMGSKNSKEGDRIIQISQKEKLL